MRTTPPARLATQWHCWLLVHSFLGFPGVGCFQFSIGITSLRGCLKSEAMKSEKMFQITVFFCLCYSHLQVSSLLLLSLYWNPQQFAPDFSSHCSIKHRELSGAEWHGKSISYLKSLIELRTLEWLCLAELCLRGWAVQTCHSTGKRRGSILCRDFETDQTNVFFFFFFFSQPYFHLQDTSWAIWHWHRLKVFFHFCRLFVSVCVAVAAHKIVCTSYSSMYVHTFSWFCVNVKSSKARAWKPELLNVLLVIAWSFISRCQERAALQGKIGFWQTDL